MPNFEVLIEQAANKAANDAVQRTLKETLPTPEYLDTRQASSYLGVSTQFLEIARYKGTGPRYVKLSRAVRYRKIDLDEYMADHLCSSTAEGR